PRQRDRDDLPGPDDVAEPDAEDRDADHGDDPRTPRRLEGGSAQAGRRSPSGGRHPTRLRAPGRLPAPLLGRDEAARHDRDRALVQSAPPYRGRADDGPRRDDSGADPRPARPAPPGARHGNDPDHT